MKYKLINNKTKEETICSLVTIDVFEYYVENTVPFFNDWLYDNLDNRIWHLTNLGCLQAYHSQKCNNWSKIIATNNPNIDIPQVIDEDDDSYLLNKDNLRYIFNSGNAGSGGSMYNRVRKYSGFDNFLDTDNTIQEILVNNKVKETYHFTVQDMLDFGKYCINNQLCKEENRYYQYWEMLKLWKEQQTKIVYYE